MDVGRWLVVRLRVARDVTSIAPVGERRTLLGGPRHYTALLPRSVTTSQGWSRSRSSGRSGGSARSAMRTRIDRLGFQTPRSSYRHA